MVDPKSRDRSGTILEGTHINHRYSPAELVNLKKEDSQDYLPSNNPIYRRWLAECVFVSVVVLVVVVVFHVCFCLRARALFVARPVPPPPCSRTPRA